MSTHNPLVNDIALVKLEAPFSLSPYTQTVALPATPPAGHGDHFGIGHPIFIYLSIALLHSVFSW
jgi:trypsin